MSSRLDQLTQWVAQQLADLGEDAEVDFSLNHLSGDASFRHYYRARLPHKTYIVVDAPPAQEDSRPFVQLAAALRSAGVLTPRVYRSDLHQGFMLQEDFGDLLYLQRLQQQRQNPDRIERLYREAIDALLVLQKNAVALPVPAYNRQLLLQEMKLFDDWFCQRLLNLPLSAAAQDLLGETFEFLLQQALSQPTVLVHRDYHSRNLMIPDPVVYGELHTPGVIDFQDAVQGPYTYDLVSLLRDVYISWPQEQVVALASYYFECALQQHIVSDLGREDFLRHFDLMGLQRHLKVIGIFARLAIRDNKPGYLADIPQTIRYLLGVAENYSEMDHFLGWFKQEILPLVKQKLAAENL